MSNSALLTLLLGGMVLVTIAVAVWVWSRPAPFNTQFERVLIGKRLITPAQVELIRTGTKARGVVTGVRTIGVRREDYREIELDLMVRRPGGSQFPIHERTLVPISALGDVRPGSVIETYYSGEDESIVVVCLPPE